MNTVPQGNARAPITPRGIITTGRDNTWSPQMTDMQREIASAPFERRATYGEAFVSSLWWVVGIAVLFCVGMAL